MIAPKAGSENGADWQPTAAPWDGSRRLWSLWELMRRFDASKFVGISNYLAQLHQIMMGGRWVGFPPDEYIALKRDVDVIRQQLADMELDAAEVSASKLCDVLKNKANLHDGNHKFLVQDADMIKALSGEIVTRARDQLQSRLFLGITGSQKELFTQPDPLFGKEVADRFPSASYEIEEAGKCLALDRSTASAFHSIRCLEAGLRAISRCLAIPDPTKGADRNWSKALRDINTQIDAKWPKSGRLAGDGRFFEDVYAVLVAMQNPYRNSTMHLDQKYTGEEARHIYEMVKGFMRKLASRCDENGEPKA
jgi:hypothetical protein